MRLDYTGTADGLAPSDIATLIAELQSWRDPGADRFIHNLNVVVDGASNPLEVRVHIYRTGIGEDSIQAERDGLASTVDGSSIDFGTLAEIKQDIRVS